MPISELYNCVFIHGSFAIVVTATLELWTKWGKACREQRLLEQTDIIDSGACKAE